MTKLKSKNLWTGLIGNALDHYDLALYNLLIFYIAPTFFPKSDLVVGIIQSYFINISGLITRPLGAIFFAKLSSKKGTKYALMVSLLGVAISTGMIGLIPGYNSLGVYSTIILVIIRSLQGFFAAGEMVVSSYFIIKSFRKESFTGASALYNFSTMSGVILASVVVYYISISENPNFYWRFAFLLGFSTGIIGLILRKNNLNDFKIYDQNINFSKIMSVSFEFKTKLLAVFFVSSLSYLTYVIPFVFINKFATFITSVTYSEMIKYNSYFLVINTISIPIIGYLIRKIDRSLFMGLISFIIFISIIPLFYFLENSTLNYINFVKIWIIILGVSFNIPIYSWFYELFNSDEKYFLTGVCYQVASETLGRNSSLICFFLWNKTNSVISPAIFVSIIAIFTTIAIFSQRNSVVRHSP